MPNPPAFLQLQATLLAHRADLSRKLAGELADLRDFKGADSTGDSADAAFAANSDEMSSQVAVLDAGELGQIERALACLRQGVYGICENCQKRIPLVRQKALPFATFCIKCERELENCTEANGVVPVSQRRDSGAPGQTLRCRVATKRKCCVARV